MDALDEALRVVAALNSKSPDRPKRSTPRGSSLRASEAARSGHSVGTSRRLALVAACVGGTTLSCGAETASNSEIPGPWETVEVGHVVYHARPGDPLLCEPYVERASAHVAQVFDLLDVDDAHRRPVEWYALTREELDAAGSPCDHGATGCAVGRLGYGVSETFEHELVHMAASAVGRPPPLFTEGLAVSLSCSPDPHNYALEPAGDWRFYLRNQAVSLWPSRFVTYLLDRHGPTPFARFYRALAFDASETGVIRTFADVYGNEIDDAWEAMLSDRAGRYCSAAFSCATPILAEGDARLGRACDATLARRLTSETSLITTLGAGTRPRWCQIDASASYLLPFETERPFWFAARGLEVALSHDGKSPPASLTIERAAGFLSTSCADTLPIRVDGPGYVQRALLAPGTGPLFVEYDAVAGTMQAREYSGYTNHEGSWIIETCSGCQNGNALGCQELAGPREGHFWVKIEWREPFVPEFFALEVGFQ